MAFSSAVALCTVPVSFREEEPGRGPQYDRRPPGQRSSRYQPASRRIAWRSGSPARSMRSWTWVTS
jgi:hypothetical protein